MLSSTTLTGFFFIFWAVAAEGFSLASISLHRPLQTSLASKKIDSAQKIDEWTWTSLTDDGGVKLQIIDPSSPAGGAAGKLDLKGKDVTVKYIASIAPRNWGVEDVIDCWLPDQGLPSLAPELFRAFEIDGKRLTNSKKFSEKFIKEGLGVLKDAKQTTLFEAAQDLKRSEQTHRDGTVFDENQFSFRPGKGQVISAFDLAVAEMKVGDQVSLVARADYAYGNKGLQVKGKVLVPPYATVHYDVSLVEVK